jgi:hypothetical protein
VKKSHTRESVTFRCSRFGPVLAAGLDDRKETEPQGFGTGQRREGAAQVYFCGQASKGT